MISPTPSTMHVNVSAIEVAGVRGLVRDIVRAWIAYHQIIADVGVPVFDH